jgi:hypothetical protein
MWTQEDVNDFLKNNVLPPGYKIKGFCGGFKLPFVEALAFALSKLPGADEDNTPLLEALRKKYPEAVEAYLPEAERMAQEAISELQA